MLHPALQHHIVNSLGWRELRPFQEAVIPPIVEGRHMIVLAPTAGGKTEAAIFPLMSRMLNENWSGLSLLYICPIKALLNNLDIRLRRYFELLGRRSALWHGDVKTSARRRIQREPPDCLLTTPESLEVMLVSPSVDSSSLLANLKAVVIDEIHAFAGDDRGWHLLAVLERVERLAGRELQRVGLSATVGNPETLLDWLVASRTTPRGIYRPENTSSPDADVRLDFVGSLENAAQVIARLHQGEKRLVFVDSRSRAEQLGAGLRRLGVASFVTHSSLSQEQRHQAEEAFASRENCVIVATSVLELGVDVGDLDRVIQIDSPRTVSSFLQRMGRTGRRANTQRNCLFLATRDEALLQAAALIDLWSTGYIEPIEPPTRPYHVLVQQLLALVLQHGSIGRNTWYRCIDNVPAFGEIPTDTIEQILNEMLHQGLLWEEAGMLGIGPTAEDKYGRRNFLELMSVFLSPPQFAVLHGRTELGFVDELTFLGKQEGPRVLLLGGRAWQVTHIDWPRRTAYVEATDAPGRSRWKGFGLGVSLELAQSIKRILATEDANRRWSKRAEAKLAELRDDFAWVSPERTSIITHPSEPATWWTFAGYRANACLAGGLAEFGLRPASFDSLAIHFDNLLDANALPTAIDQLRSRDPDSLVPAIDDRAATSIKFADCLPGNLLFATAYCPSAPSADAAARQVRWTIPFHPPASGGTSPSGVGPWG